MPLYLVTKGKATPWIGGPQPTGKSDWAIVTANTAEEAVAKRSGDLYAMGQSISTTGYKFPPAGDSEPCVEVQDEWIEDAGPWERELKKLELVTEDIKSDTHLIRSGNARANLEPKRSNLSGNSAVVVAAQTLSDKLETWLENSNGDKWVRVKKEELADLFATADWLASILAER